MMKKMMNRTNINTKNARFNSYFVEKIEFTVNRLHNLAGITHADMMHVAQEVSKSTSSNLPFVIGVIMRKPHDFNRLYTMPTRVVQNLYENLEYFSKDPTAYREENEIKEEEVECECESVSVSYVSENDSFWISQEREAAEKLEKLRKKYNKNAKKMRKAILAGDADETKKRYLKAKKLYKKMRKIADEYDL